MLLYLRLCRSPDSEPIDFEGPNDALSTGQDWHPIKWSRGVLQHCGVIASDLNRTLVCSVSHVQCKLSVGCDPKIIQLLIEDVIGCVNRAGEAKEPI